MFWKLVVAAAIVVIIPACALLSQLGEPQNQVGIGQTQKHTDQKAGDNAILVNDAEIPIFQGPGSTVQNIKTDSWVTRILAVGMVLTWLLPSPAKRIRKAACYMRKLGWDNG